MKLPFLNVELEVGSKYLTTELRDSSGILGDHDALQTRMAADGYLLLRGLHDRDHVLSARRHILEKLSERGMLDADAPLADGIFNPGYEEPSTSGAMGNIELTRLPSFRQVVEGSPIINFFEHFLGGGVLTYDHKWLRTVGTGAGSAIHCDVVYMGRGTLNLYTCWTPIGDISLDMGPLVLCLGSHRFDKVAQTYGQADVDRDLIEGHFSNDPIELVDKFGGRWATTEFQAGDTIIFCMNLMHASLINTSDKVRISVDVRHQLASEPVDERWVGDNPIRHYAWQAPGVQHEPLEESRRRWDI